MNYKRWCSFVILGFAFTPAIATATQDIRLVGEIQQPLLHQNQISQAFKPLRSNIPTSVTLIKLELSDKAWSKLEERTEALENTTPQTLMLSKSTSVQLGMSNVPVLDQGKHGTCVTFANAAAINAVLNQGDYISELCLLQLGSYLEKYGYNMSGWEGAMGPDILHQIQMFGIVSKKTQLEQGCGGLTEYPLLPGETPKSYISITDYHLISEELPSSRVSWSPVLDAYQAYMDKISPDSTFKQVIHALNSGDRLTFGVLLFNIEQGAAGAVGKHNVTNDTWVLSTETIESIRRQTEFGGHEMIITGYDDNAVAVDPDGHHHKGLLTLRNSWGPQVGDQGDFYMSYDYFKTLTLEIQRIRALNE